MTLQNRLAGVQEGIVEACHSASRNPESVRLIAVSKTRPAEMIQEAIQSSHLDFGENYAQELRDKAKFLGESNPNLRWHYIGRIQRNKAKYIGPNAYRIHTLENAEQAQALLKRAPKGIDALLAINIGREDQKSGIAPEAAIETAQTLAHLEGCRIRGLMCIPPIAQAPEDNRAYFEEMESLMEKGRAAGLPWQELSMGMSADYTLAIECSATWVRIGTAIFGPRA